MTEYASESETELPCQALLIEWETEESGERLAPETCHTIGQECPFFWTKTVRLR